jgi:Transglycosylase
VRSGRTPHSSPNQATDSLSGVSAELIAGPLPQSTTITDSRGTPIAHLFAQDRELVTADELAPAMIAALVAVEDRRFFEHDGVDWPATLRAVLANTTSGDIEQGASTLTQQYVKNYTLYALAESEAEQLQAVEQTPARKLREVQIALQLERQLSKHEILTRYLNTVYWGNGAYGIVAAGPHVLRGDARPAHHPAGRAARRDGAQPQHFRPGPPPGHRARAPRPRHQPHARARHDRHRSGAGGAREPARGRLSAADPAQRLPRRRRQRLLLQLRDRVPGRRRHLPRSAGARRLHDPHHPRPGRDGRDDRVTSRS